MIFDRSINEKSCLFSQYFDKKLIFSRSFFVVGDFSVLLPSSGTFKELNSVLWTENLNPYRQLISDSSFLNSTSGKLSRNMFTPRLHSMVTFISKKLQPQYLEVQKVEQVKSLFGHLFNSNTCPTEHVKFFTLSSLDWQNTIEMMYYN